MAYPEEARKRGVANSARVRLEARIARFWSRHTLGDAVTPELGPCWIWTHTVGSEGYGQIMLNPYPMGAHRFMYELVHQVDLRSDQHVCHRCDVKLCVNPDHLFVGSILDNVNDMLTKGRNPRGSEVGTAKLTESAVRDIRSTPKRYGSGRELARKYGVDPWTIYRVVRRETWNHVD